jgi:hypothetical protein
MGRVAVELQADDLFLTRSGVCVYVNVGSKPLRVQFTAPDALGVVSGEPTEDAELALTEARGAVRRHQQALAPLFEQVSRRQT